MFVKEPGDYRRRFGIPEALGSCHTAVVDGCAIERHVPAREIHRLLAKRPRAAGLAVSAMPCGSHGMEAVVKASYDVLLIQGRGRYSSYARYAETQR